jgi:hypothetical protein
MSGDLPAIAEGRFSGILPEFPKGACETLRILGNQQSQSQAGSGDDKPTCL